MDSVKGVFIVLVVFGFLLGSRYLRHRMRMFELNLQHEKDFSSELQTKLEKIDDRLASLEKIVTDKGYQLDEEIEKLRSAK